MSDITTFSKRYVGQLESLEFPTPRLASDFGINDLEFTLTAPLFNEDGDVPTLDGSLVIRNLTTKYPEGINVKASNISADGLTVTLDDLTQRGLPVAGENGVDYAGGIEENRSSHPQNSDVRWQISPLDNMAMQMTLTGEIGTGSRTFKVGDGTANTSQGFEIDQGLEGPTRYGANATGEPVVTLPDGSSYIVGAGVGTITGGDGITVTAGDIDIDATDTTIFVETTAGATDEGKVVTLNASGLINQENLEIIKDVTATASELNKLASTSANVSSTNLNTLTGGTSADSLHTHGVGIKTVEVSASDNLKQSSDAEVTTGSVGPNYQKAKEIKINRKGVIRVKYDYKMVGTGTAYFNVFVDGIVAGTEITTSTEGAYITSPANDVNVNIGSLVQLYFKRTGAFYAPYAQNFIIYYDIATVEDTVVII